MPESERREQILQAAFDVACRNGIGGLSLRAVAAEAGISHGLVLFHFRTKEAVLHGLLDWLIADMAVLHVSQDIASFPHARDRFHALMQQEMARLSRRPQHTRLFLEFWALGVRDAVVRSRISAELERYRQAFRSIMEELLDSDPAGFESATADGLAAASVSWIHGCAVQAMIEPDSFDTDGYLAAVRRMIGGMS